MLFVPSKHQKEEYIQQVKDYIANNDIKVLGKLSILNYELPLDEEAIKKIFKEFPVASWLTKKDIKSQLKTFLKFTGYNFNILNDKLYLVEGKKYKLLVEDFCNSYNIAESINELCEKTTGGIPYYKLKEILGYHYPLSPYLKDDYENKYIILFLKEAGFLIKYNGDYVFFL